jgi:hypothetical protein
MVSKKDLKIKILKALAFIAPTYAYRKFIRREGSFTMPEIKLNSDRPAIIGIIKEPRKFHYFYIAACEEMDIPYQVIDIMRSDWIDVIKKSGCKGFLVWPSAASTVWKNMYDERLKVIDDELEIAIFPPFNETWVWESKRRMHYWLESNEIKHPNGWVFYDYDEAKSFLDAKKLPLVFKTNHGDSSAGVKIIRKRSQANSVLNMCFGRGTNMGSGFARDIEWGSMFIQEYIANPTEWRMIRIGDSYFGYQKVRKGDFASGSGDAVFKDIPFYILDYIREITDAHKFKSMSFDVLIDENQKMYIIELQSLFGDTKVKRKLMINNNPGRYKYDYNTKQWIFEIGIFDQNNCCNLRVECLLELINHQNQ